MGDEGCGPITSVVDKMKGSLDRAMDRTITGITKNPDIQNAVNNAAGGTTTQDSNSNQNPHPKYADSFQNIEGFCNESIDEPNIMILNTLMPFNETNFKWGRANFKKASSDYWNNNTQYINFDKYNRNACISKASPIINTKIKSEISDISRNLIIFNSAIEIYKVKVDYPKYLGGIINDRLDFLDKIKNKINTYNQNNHIDNRKNNYLSNNLEFYKNIHFYIFILYYVIFILFLIFSNFIKDKLYENKYVMIYVIIILILPFILRYILSYIYNLYISYIERNYLKLDEISYKYLVEETDHQIKNEKDQEQLNNYYATRNS